MKGKKKIKTRNTMRRKRNKRGEQKLKMSFKK
jgi:hypothetical protein